MDKGIILVGAGGHAKVCIELLQAMGCHLDYCVGGPDSPDKCLDIPVLKGDDNLLPLHRAGYNKAFVAVGSNSLRVRLARLVIEIGYHLVNAISPHAIVSPSTKLGKGIAIMAGAVINADATIDDLSIINTGVTIDHDCKIEKAVHIAPQSGLAGKVHVGEYSLLGIGCKVIPEVKIGKNVEIGAGSVVISDIADNSKVAGVPARTIVH